MSVWHAITAFGDSALLLPVIAWMAVCQLAAAPWRRDGWRWIAAAVACGGCVSLSKLLFMAWHVAPPGIDYTGFSGHTALAILVWTAFAAIVTRGMPLAARVGAIAAGASLGVAVGASRLALKVHSPSEVWLGGALSVVVAAWFIAGMSHAVPARDRASAWRLTLLGGTLAIGLVCYGRVFPSQHLLQDIALWLSGHSRVFTRL